MKFGRHPYGKVPPSGRLAFATPEHWQLFGRIAGIFARNPEIPNPLLARRLRMPASSLKRVLQLMLRHDPERFKLRAAKGNPVHVYQGKRNRPRWIRRRLTIHEMEAQNEMIAQAVEATEPDRIIDGRFTRGKKPLETISRAIPMLPPRRLWKKVDYLRRVGRLTKDTRMAGGSGRERIVVQAQLGLVARKLLDGIGSLAELQRELNEQTHRVRGQIRHYAIRDKKGASSLKDQLRLRVRLALEGGATKKAAIMNYLGVTSTELEALAKILGVKMPAHAGV